MVGRHIIFEEDKEVLIALDAIRICMELLWGSFALELRYFKVLHFKALIVAFC